MSALADALIAAGITYAWSASPLRGRVVLWVRMNGEELGVLTMTDDQARQLRAAFDVRL